MNTPKELKYTASHEWVKGTGEKTVQIGLTDHAQSELGDLVFVNLPTVGDAVVVGDTFGDVESVKAVSDIYSPVTGTIIAINEQLLDNPALINNDCYDAWLVEVGDVSQQDELLDADAYEELVGKEG